MQQLPLVFGSAGKDALSLVRLEVTPFVVVLSEILTEKMTGYLTVASQHNRKVLYWSNGELVMAGSSNPEDSLGSFLERKGHVSPAQAEALKIEDATEVVGRFHDMGGLDLSRRQSILREWMTSIFTPLFSLDVGTAVFSMSAAIDPEKRIFLPSTGTVVLEGVRSISNGLVIRRSLGDANRQIATDREGGNQIDSLPLTPAEHKIAAALSRPATIDAFLKQFPSESLLAGKTVIAMMTLGVFKVVENKPVASRASEIDATQRDLALLASIGSNDPRSLKAVSLSRQLDTINYYQLLDVPKAATRAQIMLQSEEMKKRYDPATYPSVVRDATSTILRRIEDATNVLKDSVRRQEYDKLLDSRRQGDSSIQQKVTQRSIGEQNFAKARGMALSGDYYGAIVLLQQSVRYLPDNAEAWYLLGTCQERNPKWRRDAMESFQKVLAINPNHTETLISLGDLYKNQGMASRAQTCYEDVIRIEPENAQAKSRLKALKGK